MRDSENNKKVGSRNGLAEIADESVNKKNIADGEMGVGLNEIDNTWEVIIKYNGDILKIENEIGVGVEILSENYAIVRGNIEKINQLNAYGEVEHIELAKKLLFTLENSVSRSCIPSVWSGHYGLTGKGVLVAVIDSGIDFTHPDFSNEDGSSRILYIWDQTVKGIPPKGFKSGTEYSKEDIDKALTDQEPFRIIPQIDILGHGTAVAGVAAGNGRSSQGEYKGIAPESSLIIVKLGQPGDKAYTRTTEMMRGIKYVIDKAVELNLPVVINISYGTNNGSHDGNSLFETYINDMCNKWKTSIVVATGNEGVSSHHYSGEIKQDETAEIDFYSSNGLSSFFISMWKNFVDIFSVELILPNGKTTGEILYFERLKVVTLDDINIYIKYDQPNHYNKDQEIFFEIIFDNKVKSEGLWQIRIKGTDIVDGRFDIWLPITEIVSEKTAFSRPSYLTTLTLPSTAKNVISVGAYDSTNNTLADFSGRGYTRNNVYVKPDLVAPGVNILGPKIGGNYDALTGTSFATPFVTGAAALMMQWGIVQGNDQFLYGQRLKAFLQLGAKREPGREYPNPDWGYGTLCLEASMSKLNDYAKKGYKIPIVSASTENTKIPPFENKLSFENMSLEEFLQIPDVMSFHARNVKKFTAYIKDKPYVKIGTVFPENYVVAYTLDSKLAEVILGYGEDYINMVPLIFTLLDRQSLEESGIARVQQQPVLDLQGNGVLIGFVDTGIDYTQKAFQYEDGTTKIQYIWDQTIEGTPPEDMRFGTVYNQERITKALQAENPFDIVPHKDTVGHGTFLASVAASRENSDYKGAAPDAEIIMVKLKKAKHPSIDKSLSFKERENAFASTETMLGIKFILDKAAELKRPVVICIALGSNSRAHDGFSLIEEYLTEISNQSGTIFCTAAGNESNQKHHAVDRITKSGETRIFGIRVGGDNESFSVYITYPLWDKISVAINTPTGEKINRIPLQNNKYFEKEFILEKSHVTIGYFVGTNRIIHIKILDATPGIWEIVLYGDLVIGSEIHAWLPITGLIGPNIEFLTPNPYCTIVNPATSLGTITVGAYDGKDNRLYVSSSWGPTTLPRISPDFVAPGVDVPGIYPTGYGVMTGTSVSAALTAGACALLLEWGIVKKNEPDMNSNRARALLIRGCVRESDKTYPNEQWGFGKLNLFQSFTYLKEM